MFQKNEGPADRSIRLVAGAVAIAVGLSVLGALEASVLGIVVAAFGLWLVITGAVGFCPLYVLLGISTVPKVRDTSRIARGKLAA